MKFNELQTSPSKSPLRVGRGIAAGRGKTAGRGTKGQGSRKSGSVRAGFEGGQMPLYMRIPKLRGFKSHRSVTETIYTSQLDAIKKGVVDNQAAFEAGLASSPHVNLKVLLGGEITSKKDVKLQSASAGAVQAITKAGGNFTAVNRLARSTKKKSTES
ncbi:50S ribosomal protein L15 [Candidatus Saccharibacteria bacterium CG10_big_fil_rev_8_21_14_0_10_47_8]|nr:MAG: 50S ribosomal protein L15 [Candidatus Saccharibacteria bacterium CG10_big_fil_rev_8_21_14_0_10_47_8]